MPRRRVRVDDVTTSIGNVTTSSLVTSDIANLQITKILSEMPPDRVEAFRNFCSHRPGLSAIQSWLREETGKDIAASQIKLWLEHYFPTGRAAIDIQSAAGAYRGIDPTQTQEFTLGMVAELTSLLAATIASRSSELADVDINSLVKAMIEGAREARGASSELRQQRYLKDRAELEMAGAERAIQLVRQVFRDTQLFSVVDNACRGALEQIEVEIFGVNSR